MTFFWSDPDPNPDDQIGSEFKRFGSAGSGSLILTVRLLSWINFVILLDNPGLEGVENPYGGELKEIG